LPTPTIFPNASAVSPASLPPGGGNAESPQPPSQRPTPAQSPPRPSPKFPQATVIPPRACHPPRRQALRRNHV
jgi:hypothetical protein